MNFAKNKYGIALLVILAVALGHYLFFYEPCKPLTDKDLFQEQVACWQAYDKSNFKQLLCQELRGATDCELYEEIDGAAVEAIIVREVQPCVDKALKDKNFCKKEEK